MAADEKEVFPLGELHRLFLVEHLPLGGKVDDMGLFLQFLGHSLVTAVDGVRLHQHPHTAAVGSVVYPVVLIGGVIADAVAADVQIPASAGPPDDALPADAFAHLHKQRGDINSHRQTAPSADG